MIHRKKDTEKKNLLTLILPISANRNGWFQISMDKYVIVHNLNPTIIINYLTERNEIASQPHGPIENLLK